MSTLNGIAKKLYNASGVRLAPGQRTRMDHGSSCPSGTDTRGRLYVTRCETPNHVYLWYCHNCTEGGSFVLRDGRVGPLTAPRPGKDTSSEYINRLWEEGQECKTIPPHHAAYEWLNKTGNINIRADLARWHPVEQAIMFPANKELRMVPPSTELGSIEALQLRKFVLRGPKCITLAPESYERPMRTLFVRQPARNTVVIVEDFLSACRICDSGMGDAYTLYGAHSKIEDLAYLTKVKNYCKIVVWLDNDNDQVKAEAIRLANRADLLGVSCVIVGDKADPKRYDVPQVRNAIEAT